MHIENRLRKFNVSTNFFQLSFLICLFINVILSETNTKQEPKKVQRYEKGATKLHELFLVQKNDYKNPTGKLEQQKVGLESIADISEEVGAFDRAPDPLSSANANLEYTVKIVRRKKQAAEGENKIPGAEKIPESVVQTPALSEGEAVKESSEQVTRDIAEQTTDLAENSVPVEISEQTPASVESAEQSPSLPKSAEKTLSLSKSAEKTPAVPKSLNETEAEAADRIACKDGLILRAWRPQNDVSETEMILRGIIYFLVMCYLFLGIYIATNRFMEAIEVITSSEREASVINKNGKIEKITVRIWNDTVANLTLMALGSSAPEIILSVFEMFQKNFVAGDLGPGTILGSAAYNLFVIMAVCIVAVPKDEARRIEKYRVFIVTAIWSIIAYVWLCLITKFITPGVIDLWEGLLTIIFFPLLVYHAYITDRRLFCPSFYQTSSEKQQRGDIVNADDEQRPPSALRSSIKHLIDGPEWRDFEQSRREYIVKLKELHRKYPHYSLEKIEAMAQRILIKKSNKSIAFYRIQSSRRTMGGTRLMMKSRDFTADEMSEAKALLPQADHADEDAVDEDTEARIYFAPSDYMVMENAGHVTLHVWRRGNLITPIKVEYYTEDGTAVAGEDYAAAQGVLVFEPGVEEQIIRITIIDDEIIEDDEHFYVYLQNASANAVIVTPKVATVMIFDDDHCGVFGFIDKVYYIPETIAQYEVKVVRSKGSRGKVLVPYFTSERTAINGKDFEDASGYLEFEKGAIEKTITINIIQEHSLEKDVVFELHIAQPILADDDPLQPQIEAILSKPPEQRDESDNLLLSGLPTKSKLSMTTCHIVESTEFRQTVNKLVQNARGSKLIGASSWKQQFRDSLYVSGSWEEESDEDEDIDDDEGVNERAADKEQEPSTWEYVAHFLTIFWKICFAIIPPAKIYKGYPCFIISLFVVGLCTSILGDVASHFGCTLGVHDSVTAICFVAFGTSLPDTFVSRIAAKHDSTADNAIGNVTGSNAVNVFLGIGLAWTVAVIYHLFNGHKFRVPVGSILFSTILFIAEAFFAFLLLLWRRHTAGGELGGPEGSRYFHCSLFIGLWVIYIIVSSLQAYGIIGGF